MVYANQQDSFGKRLWIQQKRNLFAFKVSPADPCMLFKENELGVCIIIMYVDDMLIFGRKEWIQEFATKIQKRSFCEDPTQPSKLFGL